MNRPKPPSKGRSGDAFHPAVDYRFHIVPLSGEPGQVAEDPLWPKHLRSARAQGICKDMAAQPLELDGLLHPGLFRRSEQRVAQRAAQTSAPVLDVGQISARRLAHHKRSPTALARSSVIAACACNRSSATKAEARTRWRVHSAMAGLPHAAPRSSTWYRYAPSQAR